MSCSELSSLQVSQANLDRLALLDKNKEVTL
jgi:hypothetical protein